MDEFRVVDELVPTWPFLKMVFNISCNGEHWFCENCGIRQPEKYRKYRFSHLHNLELVRRPWGTSGQDQLFQTIVFYRRGGAIL